jgi:hypothetical protein
MSRRGKLRRGGRERKRNGKDEEGVCEARRSSYACPEECANRREKVPVWRGRVDIY